MINRSKDLAQKILLTVVSFLLVLTVAEIAARSGMNGPLDGQRPFEPFFVSGDNIPVRSELDLLEHKWGPATYGYSPVFQTFFYSPDKPATASDRVDFLFDHSLSRYTQTAVNQIIKSKSGSIVIFVVGGSAAQGTGATGRSNTWHALLEQRLRVHFNYPDIYIFNAAMGAFMTSQERIAYDMAVAPKSHDLTIILDGFNDMYLPVIFGTMPGDPYQTGRRYYQIYNLSIGRFLSERSALFNYFSKRVGYRTLVENTKETFSDKAKVANLSAGITNVYKENIDYLIQRGATQAPVLVFFQPWRDYARTQSGRKPQSRLFWFYMQMSENIRQHFKSNSRFIDISTSMNDFESTRHFIDLVHLDNQGQKILADAMFPHIQKEVELALKKKSIKSAAPHDGGKSVNTTKTSELHQ